MQLPCSLELRYLVIRFNYDQRGKEGVEGAPQMDSAALFAMIFGSEKFEPLVGELQLASQMGKQGGCFDASDIVSRGDGQREAARPPQVQGVQAEEAVRAVRGQLGRQASGLH